MQTVPLTVWIRNVHNIALFLLLDHILNCRHIIHSSGIRDGIVRSFNAIRVFVYCHILRPSAHSINLCCSVSVTLHLWQEFEGVIFIRWSIAFVGIKSCSTWYHIRIVLSDRGHPLDSSIFVSNPCWAIFFVWAFQGIQQQHICLLEGLCRVFYCGTCGFQSQFLWVCMLLQCCSDKDSRILQVSFLSVGVVCSSE